MRVWTIQPALVWARLLLQRVLLVDPKMCFIDGPEDLTRGQRWLIKELTHRVEGYSGGLPWWAWAEKPDLRIYSHRRFGLYVRLELELEPFSYKSFPSWAWQRVYDEDFLPSMPGNSIHEDSVNQSAIRNSWKKLFDEELVRSGLHPLLGKLDAVEVVFEKLNLDDVVRCTFFQGVDVSSRRENPVYRGADIEISETETQLIASYDTLRACHLGVRQMGELARSSTGRGGLRTLV